MTSTRTETRYLLSSPNPRTQLAIGQWYSTTHFAGIGVDTDQHVRLYATGTDLTASDLVAQATGQVWIHSLAKLVAFAKKDVLVASRSVTSIAGEGGVTIIAGFSPGDIASETTPDTFPSAIESYEAKGALLTGVWVCFDTFMAITITAVQLCLTIKDSGWAGLDRWAVEGSLANLTGASINLAGLSFIPWSSTVSLPGINLFSQAGTLIGAAFGCVNVIGLPGTLIASTFTTQFGLLTAGVRGFFSTGMSALGPVDVSALGDVTCRGYAGLTFAARLGKASLRGTKMIIGTELVPWVRLPQLPTTKVEMKALKEVAVESPAAVTLVAKKMVTTQSTLDTTLKAVTKAAIGTVGPFKISLVPARVFAGKAGGPGVGLSTQDVLLTGPGGAAKAIVKDGKVELDMGGAKLTVVPGVSLKVDGLSFKLVSG